MNANCSSLPLVVSSLLLFAAVAQARTDDSPVHLTLRSRVKAAPRANAPETVVERKAEWDPKKTAVIVVDMWDDHWCKSAAKRVVEMAGPMNKVLRIARGKGMFIIHAPSSVVNYYKDTPQRKRAQEAPFAKTPVPLSTSERWGTAWCWPDVTRESDLPIDDSDMGCDCRTKCAIPSRL